ncbi:MAG: hypothetical protein IPP40_16365 [bacterium]|nr:hypothetical protein [bacterium]
MSKNSTTAVEKPREYGFLLVLAALALVMWFFSRFFGWGRTTKPVLSKKAEKLQREIETLEILQEQAKLDLRRVRLEQKTLQTEEDKEKESETATEFADDALQSNNGHFKRPE